MPAILIFVAVFASFPRAICAEPKRLGTPGTEEQNASDISASPGKSSAPELARDAQNSTGEELARIDLMLEGMSDSDENGGYDIVIFDTAMLQLRVAWQVLPPYPPDDYLVWFQVDAGSANTYRLWTSPNRASEIVPVIQGEWPPRGTQFGLRELPTSVWLETVGYGSGSITATITRNAPAPKALGD